MPDRRATPPEDGPGAAGCRILLADDHAVVREALRLLLESRGLEVVGEAVDGLEAIALARRVRPDVAVLDLAMPLANGIEAAREIRCACPATAVVLLIGSATEADLAALDAELAARRGDPRLVAVGEIGLDLFVPGLDVQGRNFSFASSSRWRGGTACPCCCTCAARRTCCSSTCGASRSRASPTPSTAARSRRANSCGWASSWASAAR